MKHGWRLVFPTLSLVLASAMPAFAATVVVGTCMPNKVSFDSLGDAVQGAPAGSTIQVCPGTYPEQIVINKSLTIKGIPSGNGAAAVITVPASGLVPNAAALNAGLSFVGVFAQLAAQVVVEGGADVTFIDMAVDAAGASSHSCNQLVVGLLAQDASLTLNRVAIRNQIQGTCIAFGVFVQNDSSVQTTVKVQNSTFVNSSQAFEADGGSVVTTLTSNSFAGNPTSASNAISILTGSSTIQNNTISNYNYPAAVDVAGAALGVYLCGVHDGSVANNTIAFTQVGVIPYNGCATSGVSITNNKISFSQIIGIDVGQTNGLVQGNDIRTSQTAIRLPGGSSGNTIQGNLINDACAAFGSNPVAGTNTILNNTVANVATLSLVNNTGFCP